MHVVSPAKVSSDVSSRIRILRFVLIAGLVAVHVPPADEVQLSDVHAGWFPFVRTLLSDVLFLAAVPMLSVISGYLFGHSRHPYLTLLAKKTRSLLIPLILWNVGMVILVSIAQTAGWIEGPSKWGPLFDAPMSFLNAVLGVFRTPLNAPLYFLRDLFICFLFAPLLRSLARSRSGYFGGGLILLLLSLSPLKTHVLLREDIVLWFFIGVGLAVHGTGFSFIDRCKLLVWILYSTMNLGLTFLTVFGPGLSASASSTIIFSIRFLALPAWWALAGWASGKIPNQTRDALSQTSFFIFCAHSPMLVILWNLWSRFVSLEHQRSWYPLFYFAAWLTVVGSSVLIFRMMKCFVPRILSVLNGGRVTSKHR